MIVGQHRSLLCAIQNFKNSISNQCLDISKGQWESEQMLADVVYAMMSELMEFTS